MVGYDLDTVLDTSKMLQDHSSHYIFSNIEGTNRKTISNLNSSPNTRKNKIQMQVSHFILQLLKGTVLKVA